MTSGTITLPMTPMPMMTMQKTMEVVRMYPGNSMVAGGIVEDAADPTVPGFSVVSFTKRNDNPEVWLAAAAVAAKAAAVDATIMGLQQAPRVGAFSSRRLQPVPSAGVATRSHRHVAPATTHSRSPQPWDLHLEHHRPPVL